jgi:hypothetical protein
VLEQIVVRIILRAVDHTQAYVMMFVSFQKWWMVKLPPKRPIHAQYLSPAPVREQPVAARYAGRLLERLLPLQNGYKRLQHMRIIA